MAGAYAKVRVDRDNEGTDIQRGTVFLRDPFGVELDQLFQRLHHEIDVDRRDAKALVRYVHTLEVLARTEEQRSAVGGVVRLHALEDLLPVMQAHCRGRNGYVAVRNDPRVVPTLSGGVVHNEHMVGEVIAEGQVAVIRLLLSLLDFLNFDFHFSTLRSAVSVRLFCFGERRPVIRLLCRKNRRRSLRFVLT